MLFLQLDRMESLHFALKPTLIMLCALAMCSNQVSSVTPSAPAGFPYLEDPQTRKDASVLPQCKPVTDMHFLSSELCLEPCIRQKKVRIWWIIWTDRTAWQMQMWPGCSDWSKCAVWTFLEVQRKTGSSEAFGIWAEWINGASGLPADPRWKAWSLAMFCLSGPSASWTWTRMQRPPPFRPSHRQLLQHLTCWCVKKKRFYKFENHWRSWDC